MQQALTVAQYAVTAAFVLLGLLTFRGWLANRQDRSRGFLALALGLLGGVALLCRLVALTDGWAARALTDLSIAGRLGSGPAVSRCGGPFRRVGAGPGHLETGTRER